MSKQSFRYSRSHLFTVRLWQEEVGDTEREVRGEVRHLQSGDVLYFRAWGTLEEYLAKYMHGLEHGDYDF